MDDNQRLFDAVGTFIGPVQRKRFDRADIVAIRDKATKCFVGYPYRLRLPGMKFDLNDDDKRALAYFEAAVEVLNRLGALDADYYDAIRPVPYTEVQEVITEGIVGHTFTPQK
jgi:hypothetical protein